MQSVYDCDKHLNYFTCTAGHVYGHPWTIPGWLSYLGIPGYLDKGGGCVWPSLDNPGMAKLLGNPGILGQGGGGMCVAIPGQSRDG